MKDRIPLPVRLCLGYNRLFAFRARQGFHRELAEADRRRHADAKAEDLRYAAMEFAKAEQFLRKFPVLSLHQQRVLDFGCRFGGASLWFAQQGAAQVIGVDVVSRMLEIAAEFVEQHRQQLEANRQAPLPPIDFRLGSPRTIPVDDASIDLILSEDVVEHLSDPEAMFAEWCRILAPGGRMVLSFGPLWYHPHGLHLWEIFPAPWNHVLFSERTWMTARHLLKGDGGTALRCTELNKMTLRRFERLVRRFGLNVYYRYTHAAWRLQPFLMLPGVREFLASQVDCILTLENAAAANDPSKAGVSSPCAASPA